MPERRRTKLFAAEKALLERRGERPGSSEPGKETIRQVLDAVLELKGLFEAGATGDTSKVALLQAELQDMRDAINRTKAEIVALRSAESESESDGDRFQLAATELDAVVNATETATQGILEAAERLDANMDELRSRSDDPVTRGIVEEMASEITAIFEHCNFQDITGQRITKVVRTLQYLERRIMTMIDIWGVEQFKTVPRALDEVEESRDKLLQGPQRDGAGVSQGDIDKLFT